MNYTEDIKFLIIATVISFASAAVLGPFIIPLLKKMKFGQSIRVEGPKSHLVKSGTPTMGGLIIITAAITSTLILNNYSFKTAIVYVSLLGFGMVGFLDDYIKIALKRNLGLTAKQKLAGQFIIGIVIAIMGSRLGTETYIPFYNAYINIGFIYYPFTVLFMLAITNSVNLTDGLDGLASGVTSVVATFFVIVAYKLGAFDVSLASASILGGCLGFLIFNKYPAKVFMGDVGSLALGGAIGGLAITLKMPIIVIFVGGVYVGETLSVIIQVASFKLRQKRVFKMSPIHHHFELCGWSEVKVTSVFYFVALILCVLSYFIIF
ncbi:MAG: phospho-N-acetylmuramoyl-pentapeptide-transferase [Acidaminobacteraceae bacterium]